MARNVKFIIVEEDGVDLVDREEMLFLPELMPFSHPNVSASNVKDAILESYGSKVTGTLVTPASITSSSGVIVSNVFRETMFLEGSGGAVDITCNPQISPATILGSELTLIGSSDSNSVKIQNGNGVHVSGTIILKLRSTLKLIWDGIMWTELCRN